VAHSRNHIVRSFTQPVDNGEGPDGFDKKFTQSPECFQNHNCPCLSKFHCRCEAIRHLYAGAGEPVMQSIQTLV
jgi:hypothetical protein